MTAFNNRGRFWVVTVAALLTVALTFSLGQWQLRRAAQKAALQASLDQKSQVAPLGNAQLAGLAALNPPALAALSDRRVDITGQWQAAQTVYLDNRPMNGRPGFWVMTPLLLSGTDKVVLVQRGWIPRDFVDRSRLAPVETSAQEVRLQGRMAPAPAKLYAFKGADTGLIRQNLDIGVLAAETGLPLLPVLVLQTGPASEGLQREWAAPNTGIDKHHGYAFQWFGLSALVLGLYVWFQWVVPLRRRSKAL
jgi:surfeit locus 1 family protein